MEQKDRSNIKGMVTKCLKSADVFMAKSIDIRIVLPLFEYSLTDEIFKLLRKKLKSILDIYEQIDIYFMIIFKANELFSYEKFKTTFTVNTEKQGVFKHGKLVDFLKELQINEVADFIVEELERPECSYALIQLPNVELDKNIRINEDLILVGDMEVEYDGYFRVDEDRKQDFTFSLEKGKTYLLIRQPGWRWRLPDIMVQEPLVFKNIKHKLKILLGLSLIKGIFDITNITETPGKRNINLPIGIFRSSEWYEGIPDDVEDPIPESHPEFDDIRDICSEGDDLRAFCFQKRFFLEYEISLPETLLVLLDSLCITEKAKKVSFDLQTGKLVPLKPHLLKGKTPEEYLREEVGGLREILDSKDDYAERIKAASLWYLEGYCADNDTFKFINYTIAIESLLGEQDKENGPLTEVLSSRCGFWLGKSLKEKQDIKRRFKKELYETRSKIIHTGKTILNTEDNDKLKILEEMTIQLIADAIETYNLDISHKD